ncbi:MULTISPECIES: PepSY domain-containing protein [Flavobacteriaceae]|uniref:PepSY domain-containing protein n=1 Tax=Flavobacteriaceae TaxID=49546 RepID=UPI00234B9356|nr:PepSY domain-containing protein [Muricauda sp. SP22]MDC6361816.1 PepSY domain-containing protein [Muricauda sp. SP22]
MALSVWRYSHLILALVSSLFLLVASITGVILAVEPISNKVQPYRIAEADGLSLAQTMENLNAKYDEILSISRDRNGFISVSVIIEGESKQFYVDPFTGQQLGHLIEKAPIFQFSTNLHRSLFLKSTGRFLIGLVSFLLFLIVVSGIVLIAKRQGGIRYFFAPVVRENFSQFNHVVYSRIALLPILVLSLTGVYLSLLRFNLIPEEQIAHEVDYDSLRETPTIPVKEFALFQQTALGELRELEYPFSEFVEDYYTIRLKYREVLLNQFTGETITEKQQPLVTTISSWATVLHTGEGSIIWSSILGLGSLSIPFLMLTGFIIYFKRPKIRIKNKYAKNDCEHIILVGTEGGTTLLFAQEFHKQLLKTGKKSYLGMMNEYNVFPKMKQLTLLTATYGQGEAPASASKFMQLAEEHLQKQPFSFSVVGFGSTSYPNFCQFAYEVSEVLKTQTDSTALGEVFTINNQSFEAFSKWTNQWAKSQGITLRLEKPKISLTKNQISDFVVMDRADLTKEDTFLLTLKNKNGAKTVSGDLLSIIPNEDGRERLYSIGHLGKDLLTISVKKHPNGICSNQLGELGKGEILSAGVVKNRHFHLPKGNKETVLIATGTGIGPFLGMMATNTHKRKLHVYWGGRTPESLQLYQSYINKALAQKKLSRFVPAYSRIGDEKTYVQHLIKKDGADIAKILNKGGYVMICGSIAMQGEVLSELKKICSTHLSKNLSHYQNRNQIKMDCY